MKNVYVIRDSFGDYVCPGSFIVQGEPYKVIGNLQNARRFKSKEAAEKELQRLKLKYCNMDDTYYILNMEDK